MDFKDHLVDVFKAGEGGFGNYRIPSLMRIPSGPLLAFCEARKELSDHAQNKIVVKHSTDQGFTWGPLQLVVDSGQDALNNPLSVFEQQTESIILMYQKYPFTKQDDVKEPSRWYSHKTQNFPPNVHEAVVQPGYDGEKICRTYLVSSGDFGSTWSRPQEITRSVKRPHDVTCYGGGPGTGIQLSGGKYKDRLLMPFYQGPWGKMKVYGVYSDNLGETWQYGQVAPTTSNQQAGEVQMVEMAGGKIMLNARSFQGNGCRLIAFSEDGGETWSDVEEDLALIEPECQGSIIKYINSKTGMHCLFFSNPADRGDRYNGSLKLSRDNGNTWSLAKIIYEGSFGYSCLSQISDDGIGALFERDNYSSISFSSYKVEKLNKRLF